MERIKSFLRNTQNGNAKYFCWNCKNWLSSIRIVDHIYKYKKAFKIFRVKLLVISSYLIQSTLLNFVSYLSAQFIFQHCASITTVGLPVWASFKRKRTISIHIRFTVAKKNKTTEKLRADTPFPATPPSVPYRAGHKFNLNNATITNYYRVSRVIETIHQRQWSFCPHSRFLSLSLAHSHT